MPTTTTTTVTTTTTPRAALAAWTTVLGDTPSLGEPFAGRDLWPVTAEDGRQYFLKRLGPWRNLPLADEARVLRHLAQEGIGVAEYLPTVRASLFAGAVEESFVLMPRLADERLTAPDLLPCEETIGRALASLHRALARYPWPVNSYTEGVRESLAGDLMLPPDIAAAFAPRRARMTAALDSLPHQVIHGDLTPENVLLRRPGVVAGFIDFDHLPWGPRIWDVAKYASRRLRLRWRQESGVADAARLDHLAGFLRGYHRGNPLEPAEIAALPAAIAAGNLLEVSYLQEISAGTLPRRRMPDHDAILADTIEAAGWHLAHEDEVAMLVRSVVAPG